MHIFIKWRENQIRCVVIIRWKMCKCVKINNITCKGSQYYALNSNKMTMTSMCWKSCDKYNVNMHASNYCIK
jgi:hypothetical protein